MEHIKYHDPLVRLTYQLIAALFWWVPTCAWIRKIEYEQELSCDKNALNYELQAESVASALIKATKQARWNPSACYFNCPNHLIRDRVETILGLGKIDQRYLFRIHIIGVSIGALLLLGCLAWV